MGKIVHPDLFQQATKVPERSDGEAEHFTGTENKNSPNDSHNCALPRGGIFCRECDARIIEQHDTQEIADIYMQRPVSLQCMSLGVWFSKAHGLNDEDLERSASGSETKRLIVFKGYNVLSLDVLRSYNARETRRN